MRIRALLFTTILALPSPLQAEDSPLQIIKKAQEQMNTRMDGRDPECLVCSFPTSKTSKTPGRDPLCEDLYGAACIGPNGKSKFPRQSDSSSMTAKIQVTRDRGAQALGFTHFDEALKGRMRAAGLPLRHDPEPEAWKRLKREGNFLEYSGNYAKGLFTNAGACVKDRERIYTRNNESRGTLLEVQTLLTDQKNYRSRYEIAIQQLYAQNIPHFIENKLSPQCTTFLKNPKTYPPKDNIKLATVCKDLQKIRETAIDLYLKTGTPDYAGAALAFVKAHYAPAPQFRTDGIHAPQTESAVEKQKHLLQKEFNVAANLCSEYEFALSTRADQIFDELATEVQTTRVAIEQQLNSVYEPEKMEFARTIFKEAKTSLTEIAGELITSPDARMRIQKDYELVQLLEISPPPARAYKKDAQGVEKLDPEKIDPVSILDPTVTPYSIFNDVSLAYFTSDNADYLPETSTGAQSQPARVHVMPKFLDSIQSNPYAFLSTVAHELGHHIGPRIAEVNGYDLKSAYAETLACFADAKSIRMQPNQRDETISDTISAEVIARQLIKLPELERRNALISTVEHYCEHDAKKTAALTVTCSGGHPEIPLRVSGIFGANPSIRKAVGCEGEPKKYKNCGLNLQASVKSESR